MSKLLDIFNPLFNVKEICKEFVLLEDHLSAPGKHCPDCIRKHLLRAEAFSEEAIALDKTGEHVEMLKDLPEQIRQIGNEYSSSNCDKHALGQKVRMIRKKLSPLCFPKNGSGAIGSGAISGTIKPVSAQKETVFDTKVVSGWDFWSSVASNMSVSVSDLPNFISALKSSADSNLSPYFDLEAQNVSYRVRTSEKWVGEQLVNVFKNSPVDQMIARSNQDGKQYDVSDWTTTMMYVLGKTDKKPVFEAPSSSLCEYIDNQNNKRRAYKVAADAGLYGMLKRATKCESQGGKKSYITAAKYFEKIGNITKSPYFWAKAGYMYSTVDAIHGESRALGKVLKFHPNHELKFWIVNRLLIFSKNARADIQKFGGDKAEVSGSHNEEQSKVGIGLKLGIPALIGLGIGLL